MFSRLLRDRRRGVAADRRAFAPRSRRSRPCLEGLEGRTLLTGTWSTLTNAPPGIISTMYLLTDGTVMAQAGNQASSTWYALTPDASGSYANGTWSSLPSMHDTRFAYSADVLPNGDLFVFGGEYGTGGSTAETYDPVTRTWTSAPAQTFGTLSDATGKLLGNGSVLISPVLPNTPGQTILWNSATNTWSAGPQLYRNGSADEQSWIVMRDGSILAVDGHSTSERYVPARNAWMDDATVPVDLLSSGTYAGEIGAGTLLPDGRLFQIGATGHTAFYTPSAQPGQIGTWSAGPDLPNGRGAYDTPAAVEPNGKVLIVTSEPSLSGTAQYVEYDPATNTYATVAAPAQRRARLRLPVP